MAKEQVAADSNGKKVEWKKVENTFADEQWKPEQKGESLEGVYLGYQLVSEDVNKKGEFKAYHFRRVSDGKRVSVTGQGLTTIMAQIPKKTRCLLTYQGTKKMGQGDMKVFDVLCDSTAKLMDPDDDDNGTAAL